MTWRTIVDTVTAWAGEKLRHPRIRLCLIGILLLLLGALGIPSSVWTLPMVIAGAVMIVVAWIGSRLDGRFAVEWGEEGTQLELRARIKAPAAAPPALPAQSAEATPASGLWLPRQVEQEEPTVIEGSAHTVEIDVAELKALIAAAEAEEVKAPAPNGVPAAAQRPQRPAA